MERLMKLPRNLGIILLAVWLILFGLLTAPFLGIRFAYSHDILALLGIAAGILLLTLQRYIISGVRRCWREIRAARLRRW